MKNANSGTVIGSSRRYYILVGDRETWEVSLKHNTWGFSEKAKGSWNTSNPDDAVALYVTYPTQKIIGFGKITSKYESSDILWPDEKLFGRPLWKYRVKFDKLFVIDTWDKGIQVPAEIMLNVGRKVVSRDLFFQLLKKADTKWKSSLVYAFNE